MFHGWLKKALAGADAAPVASGMPSHAAFVSLSDALPPLEHGRAPQPPAGASSSFLRSGVLVGIGIGVASVLHSVFHLVLARILGPGEYSLLASLLAVILIATPPTLALQAAVAREVASRLADEGEASAGLVLVESFHALVRRAVALAVVLAVPVAAVVFLVNVRDPVPVLATLAAVVGMFALPVAWGGLQGSRQLLQLSLAQCCFAGLKLGAGVALGLAFASAGAVMLGVAAAAGVTAVVSLLPLRRMRRQARALEPQARRIVRGFAGGPTVVLSLFAVVSGLDVLVARLALPADTAGAYAAVSFGARTLLVVPLAVTTVLFPRVVTLRDPTRERRHLLVGLAVVGAVGLLATGLAYSVPEPLVRAAFGSEYLAAAPWLGPLIGAMTLFALVNVYAYHFLSLGKFHYTLVLAGLTCVQFVLYGLFHSSPDALIAVLLVSSLLLLAASEVFDRKTRYRGPHRPLQVLPRDRAPTPELGLVSVVMPAYNEADRMGRVLCDTVVTMKSLEVPFEIVVVDDGSIDETREVAELTAAELGNVRVLGYDTNAGKGAAIVRGAQAARGDLVMFADADLEVHPRQFRILYRAMRGAGADVVTGSKLHRRSQVAYPLKRRVISWGYYAVVRSFFSLPVRDTQTGLKLYRREVLQRVMPRLLVKRFAYDLEILVNAQRLGYRIVEVPVVVTRERDLPRIGWREAFYTARDTGAVWYRTYLRRWYDRVGVEVDAQLGFEQPAGPAPEPLPELARDPVQAPTAADGLRR